MAKEDNKMVVPATVLRVIEEFVATMRADSEMAEDAIARLDNLLRKGSIPKPNEIDAALFGPPPDGQE